MTQISIIGAGPGAIDLLTIRALERIKDAEVLVWTDSLIPQEIPDLAPEKCKKIRTRSLTLEEIVPLLIKEAKSGKKVVRLHDGDPCLFGAISEQICRLSDEGIDVEVIPGISAYQATAALLKKELTIPGIVQTIILSRAGGRTTIPSSERLQYLSSIKASLCLYLSARHIEEAQKILLQYYPKDTPVAIGYRVTWKDQWLKIITLDNMAATSRSKKLIRTTLYIISPALNSTNNRSKLYNPDHNHLFREN